MICVSLFLITLQTYIQKRHDICSVLVKPLYNNCIIQLTDNQYLINLTEKENILFNQLKKVVSETFLKENTALSQDISLWKGEDIIKFQEDLFIKVKGRVSEKWFYNYFRNDIQKLPRIDMLNLLSEYVGFADWAGFVAKHTEVTKKAKQKKSYTKYILAAIAVLALAAILSFVLQQEQGYKVALCFVDETGELINEPISITVNLENETAKVLQSKQGCVNFKIKNKAMDIQIKSAYYTDKGLKRSLDIHDYKEEIRLETNVYSLILRHYSNSDTNNWKQRKEKLDKLIADDAIIYQQWFGDNKGVEMYSKEDFVYQMTIPTSILKHIEILETVYKNGKIQKLRFRVNQK